MNRGELRDEPGERLFRGQVCVVGFYDCSWCNVCRVRHRCDLGSLRLNPRHLEEEDASEK